MNGFDIAADMNKLAGFLGMRDVPELSVDSVREFFGGEKADVMVLFGGSITCGGDMLAHAMLEGIADKYVIVGGEGHTTQTLRETIHAFRPDIETTGLPEAMVFDKYLRAVYGLKADALETRSTNCGNNITNLLRLLGEKGWKYDKVILCQDSSMQRRMDAGLRKYAGGSIRILNYAVYDVQVICGDGKLVYATPIEGMWTIDRYAELLMGEIPRLSDDENGYGPRGKGFIDHVDVPENVILAYNRLSAELGINTRAANPEYAAEKRD